jgi:hypothetical protein
MLAFIWLQKHVMGTNCETIGGAWRDEQESPYLCAICAESFCCSSRLNVEADRRGTSGHSCNAT